jgi:hypothetical protein
MREEWRPVVGYESHYEVSSLGRVRRTLACRGATAGRLLRRSESRDGYRFVMLSKNDNKRTFGVHGLVAAAFIGPRPRGKQAHHKNHRKGDNRASNLAWVTNRQNSMLALASGRRGGRAMPGVSNGNARLTVRQVEEIRRQKGRIGQRVLATLCGVSKTAIQKIHQGKGWPADLRVREFPS